MLLSNQEIAHRTTPLDSASDGHLWFRPATQGLQAGLVWASGVLVCRTALSSSGQCSALPQSGKKTRVAMTLQRRYFSECLGWPCSGQRQPFHPAVLASVHHWKTFMLAQGLVFLGHTEAEALILQGLHLGPTCRAAPVGPAAQVLCLPVISPD